jgi:hypothetical protein
LTSMMVEPFSGRLMKSVRRPPMLVLLGLLAAFAVAAPASAGSCAETLIADWVDNAEIDGTYPIPCYQAAIGALPEDLRSYSSAADDIRRAQQEALTESSSERESEEPGATAAEAGAETDGETTDNGERDTQGSTKQDTEQDTLAGAPSDDGSGGDEEQGAATEDAVAAPSAELLDDDLADGSSSLPVPIIVLLVVAGLAAVALAGYLVVRQRHGRGASDR